MTNKEISEQLEILALNYKEALTQRCLTDGGRERLSRDLEAVLSAAKIIRNM